nr:MAG TPA: hypothetical protein [Caudoviricetes sp.]
MYHFFIAFLLSFVYVNIIVPLSNFVNRFLLF